MGKRLGAGIAVLIAMVWAAASARAGDSMYVRASGTELKGTAGPAGATLAKLDIGTKCEIVEQRGNWAKVTAEVKGKPALSGFVFVPKLSKEKPDKERTGGKVVASASESDTASALRGLSPSAEKFAGRTSITPENIAAVKKMEEQKVAQEELARFLKEGKLGEFVQ